jgi:tetratricopeptide (TPR) repeat protein
MFAVIVSHAATGFAYDDKYVAAMQKNIRVLYQATEIGELQQAVNGLERIASVEKTKWEPFYYASFGYIMMANREKDGVKKDAYLDQAMTSLDQAKAILSNDSEIIALDGFISMLRIAVDPATRGPQYAAQAMQAFEKASAINPENPRALALKAQMQYGTAQFFGSPATEACATLNAALEKFNTFKSDNPLAPRWGKGVAEELKKKC